MIAFLGTSHAAVHLRDAAFARGLPVSTDLSLAEVIFISEDTPTDAQGNRDIGPIRELIESVRHAKAQLVLTSQVPPGFTRSLWISDIFHQAETLRIIDAEHRAFSPEQIIVGGPARISRGYADYLTAFECPVLRMSWEDAEFSKIAINMFLAAQVDTTNRLAAAAEKSGAKWANVAKVLAHDKRIGPHAYLKPGRWQDSTHLLRDHVTLEAL